MIHLVVPATAGLGLAGYAWWAVGLPGFSLASTVAVVGPGVAAVAVAAVRRPAWLPARSQEAPRRPGMAVWIATIAVLGVWQLAAYLQEPREAYPTLSSLANTALDPQPVRAAAFLGWLTVAALAARR